MTFGRVALVAAIAGTLIVGCDGDDGSDAAAPTTVEDSGAPVPSSSTVNTAGGTVPAAESEPDEAGSPSPTTVPQPVPGATDAVDRPPVPDGSGGESLGPLGSTDVELETEEGTVQIGDADVPELAAGFPVPDGLDVQLASETGTDAGFSGVAPESVASYADFYRSALPDAGYDITSERQPGADDDADPSVVLFTFESDDRMGDIVIAQAPGGTDTSIIVTIAQR